MDDKSLPELAKEALDVQNASNLAGVAGLLQRTHGQLTRKLGSTNEASNHIITRAIIDKIVDLSSSEDGRLAMGEWTKLQDIADGDESLIQMKEAVNGPEH